MHRPLQVLGTWQAGHCQLHEGKRGLLQHTLWQTYWMLLMVAAKGTAATASWSGRLLRMLSISW
jgi:hypothetical protein